MAKIRVMLACNLLDLGGTEKAIQIFAKYLDKSRFEVFACGRLRGGVRVAEIEKMGIPVILQPPDITKLVRELKIDIYHVSRAGDYEPGSLPEKSNGWPRIVETNIFNAIDKQENERIDCYLFPSRWSKDVYLRRDGMRPKARYEALYLPVDFEEFPSYTKDFTATFGRCSRADFHAIGDAVVAGMGDPLPAGHKLPFGVGAEGSHVRLTELYVARYVTIDRYPTKQRPGGGFILSGRVLDPRYTVQGIDVCYEPLPSPPDIAWLRVPRPYGLPEDRENLSPKLPDNYHYDDGSKGSIELQSNGTFRVPVVLTKKASGIYTMVVWIQQGDADPFSATQVCVRAE